MKNLLFKFKKNKLKILYFFVCCLAFYFGSTVVLGNKPIEVRAIWLTVLVIILSQFISIFSAFSTQTILSYITYLYCEKYRDLGDSIPLDLHNYSKILKTNTTKLDKEEEENDDN